MLINDWVITIQFYCASVAAVGEADLGSRLPNSISMSPVLKDLKSWVASVCFRPCSAWPLTERISSPIH